MEYKKRMAPENRNSFDQRLWTYDAGPSVHAGWVPRSELEDLLRAGDISDETLVLWDGFPGPPFPARDRDAEFFFRARGKTCCAHTHDELSELAAADALTDETQVWGPRLPPGGLTYSQIVSNTLRFAPRAFDLLQDRQGGAHTVFCGANNAGKSALLKSLRREAGPKAQFLACNRFYHFDQLAYATSTDDEHRQHYVNFLTGLYQTPQNQENSDFNLQGLVGALSNQRRAHVFETCSRLLGEMFALHRTDPNNDLSPTLITVGGRPLSTASTGTRLLLALVAACADQTRNTLLIDEPEIGLSPRIQRQLAAWLYSSEGRRQSFPEDKHVFVATHSHLFLDRRTIENNFIVDRSGRDVSVTQVRSMTAFHELQFALLGNDLESLFLPAAIVVAEGITDVAFLRRIFQLRIPQHTIAVVNADGDGGILKKVRTIVEALGTLSSSPYRNNILVVVDDTHGANLDALLRMGIPSGHIAELSRNGIEYYYPRETVCRVLGIAGPDPWSDARVEGGRVVAAGTHWTKREFGDAVLPHVTASSSLPDEFIEKVISPVQKMLS